MLTAAFRGVVEKYKLQGVRLGDAIAGAVIKHSKDYNLVRECVLASGLDAQTPGADVQRACGTAAIRPSSIRAPINNCCSEAIARARLASASGRSSAFGPGTSNR
jgi:hypothetical protein